MRCAMAALFRFSLVVLASGLPPDATTEAQEVPGTIADNDGIFIDGTSFRIIPGKANAADISAAIKPSGARELGPGAIVFRSRQRLYIIDVPLRLEIGTSGSGRNALVDAGRRSNRIRIEYVPPDNPEHQKIYDKLKANGCLETIQKLFSPFRLPVEITVKVLGCGGLVNAWYEREKSGPTVSICYEYLDNIMRNAPMETTMEGITRDDAMVGQLLFVAAHEIGHAFFEIFAIPVFGREEDAADQFAAFFMLNLRRDLARPLIGGAAYAYHQYIKGYKENPNVLVPLTSFSSNHGSPEERYYNLLCIAFGAYPTLFSDFVESGMLPKTRARNCAYEYRTLSYAAHREIGPYLDWPLSRQVWNTTSIQK